MQSVRFQDFRAFQDSGWLELRPITLLIGENSTGKTSFLAGLRYLLQAFHRSSTTPFNREPYYLGGYSEIAHYRGGRGGRAKQFTLSISHSVGNEKPGDHAPSNQMEHQFTFGKGAPQPRILSYQANIGAANVDFHFDEPMPRAVLTRVDRPGATVAWSLKRSPPSEVIRDNSSFIAYLFDDLMFLKSARPDDGDQNVEEALKQAGLSSDALRKLVRHRQEGSTGLNQNVFASAPVRTQPLRTYTPSEVTLSSEGSHVPLELARIKARSKEEWQAVRNGLVTFGESANLFTDIDVKQFGKTDTDPFQLMFKIAGPAMNVVDVGYGISQVLPIIYQIQNPGRYSTFLLQQPEVHLHPRAQAELGTLISNAVDKHRHPLFVLETHSDYIIDRLKIEIIEGRLLPSNVTIIFFQRQQHGIQPVNIFLDKYGNFESAPDDLRAFFLQEHSRLLGI